MGILHDDVVIITQAEKEGDPSVITINCPDKTGLGCDLCRIILFFGLSIVRGGKFAQMDLCFFFFLHAVWLLRICRERKESEICLLWLSFSLSEEKNCKGSIFFFIFWV